MLLDCTLRDGGFVNDWEFGYSSIRSIVSRLDSAGIEIVEVGYIRSAWKYDKNCSSFPNTKAIDSTLAGISIDQAKLFALIDFGACNQDDISRCEESMIDGIRITFKKSEVEDALEFATEVRKKGYIVCLNPVSLTSYADKEILDLVEKINMFKPFAMSMVDTYGLMTTDEIMHYVDLVDHNLGDGIKLGYHSHNNQQLAFSNCCVVLNRHNRHDIIIDATLYGMGKSAGNANTELVTSYINKTHGGTYKIEQLLDCIYTDIMRVYKKTPWGYNLHYYLSSRNNCHHSYIKFLLEKNTLTIQGIDEIVAKIPKRDKLAYSQDLIEKLYIEYQHNTVNDSAACKELAQVFEGKTVLLVFPGSTINTHEAEIREFLAAKQPVSISIGYFPQHLETDYIFVGNRKRYDRLIDGYFTVEHPPKIIATSNILESSVPITYKINYEGAYENGRAIRDSSSALCLNFLRKLGVKEVFLAGMDGFKENGENNYADPFMNMYDFSDSYVTGNTEMKDFLLSLEGIMKLNFITPSIFDEKS